MREDIRIFTGFFTATILVIVAFFLILITGPINISLGNIFDILTNSGEVNEVERIIILESRLPMALAAIFSGAALSVAGLEMQTVFMNPLAGPSLLGVSSGASLGVAIVLLGSSIPGLFFFSNGISVVTAALIGSFAIIILLSFLSNILRNSVALLIVGMMLSYLASSAVSLLNFFAQANGVKSYVVWGLGSFSGIGMQDVEIMMIIVLCFLGVSFLLSKPLDAFLLGERYALSLGYNVRTYRNIILIVSGVLTAVVTAYCGPIAFIGLIVPHISRLIFGTSSHFILIPASMLVGAAVTVICALVTVFPTFSWVLPVNTVTPFIGVPIILYLIIKKKY